MSRILVLGCGELAWGKPSTSPLFGRQWTRGRLADGVCFGPDGPIPGESPGLDWVTLAGELDRQVIWQPDKALGPFPTIILSRGEPAQTPVLPAWSELARLQAHWATRELGGAGVLVAPKEWVDLVQGRQLLEAWAAEGWTWAALEEVLARRDPADVRFICASESWLRVIQPEGGLVFANGPESHLALEMIPAILDRALEELGAGLAGRWKHEEEPLSGWYVYQQLTQKVVKALRQGRPKVELGGGALFHVSKEGRMIVDSRGTSGVLFRFSSAEAQTRYEALSTLRITVELPASTIRWWDQVTHPGFLKRTARVFPSELRWDRRKTVLLEGVEIRQLSKYLSSHGLRWEEVDPARLEEALTLGSSLFVNPEETARKAPAELIEAPRRDATAGDPTPSRPTEPSPLPPADTDLGSSTSADSSEVGGASTQRPLTFSEPAPQDNPLAETVLAKFLPNQFTLDDAHHPDRVKVWLDGTMIEQANVRRSAQGLYTIEGIAVPHGAIMRIDFERFED
jgi:hypothetical protein